MGPCLLERWPLDEKGRLFEATFGRSIELLVNSNPRLDPIVQGPVPS